MGGYKPAFWQKPIEDGLEDQNPFSRIPMPNTDP
jgi:hypothetical protein